MTDATLKASSLLLGTRIGAGGSATLTESFFGRSPWLHGQQVTMYLLSNAISELTLMKEITKTLKVHVVDLNEQVFTTLLENEWWSIRPEDNLPAPRARSAGIRVNTLVTFH